MMKGNDLCREFINSKKTMLKGLVDKWTVNGAFVPEHA
jgi:hypothetical protein